MKIVEKNVIKKDSISSEPLYLAKQRSKLFCGLRFLGFCGFLRGLQIKIILPTCAFRCIDNNQQLPQFQACTTYVSVNSKTAHAPPRANPRAFDFFEKFWSNSPLCCQFRWSNAPPVRASKRVKSPILQACEADCGNKFCKIFSH